MIDMATISAELEKELDELEAISSSYDIADAEDAARLDAERLACRARILDLVRQASQLQRGEP